MSKLRTNLTPDELEKVAKALLGVAAARRASAFSKSIVPADGVHEAAQKPGSATGIAAPGNTAGPGRGHKGESAKTQVSGGAKTQVNQNAKTNVSANAKTAAAGGGAGKEFVYLSKKDFPKAPQGVVDSTQNSWKLPAGLGRALAAKVDGNQDGAQPLDPASFNSKPAKIPAVLVQNLKFGEIISKRGLDGDEAGASSTFKVEIEGGGSGILKPQVNVLYTSSIDSRDEKPSDEEGFEFNPKNNKWEKSVKSEFDLYAPKAIGSFGSGNMPYRMNVQREAAAYGIASLHGMSDNVPVTVARGHEGEMHSLQQWKEGYSSIYSHAKDQGVDYGTDWDVISKLVPREKHDQVAQKLMDLAVLDIVMNNQDRHGNNYIISKTGDVQLIDHGFAFGNSVAGNRNHMLQNVFHRNKPIQVSDSLLKNMKNKSLGDYSRAMPGMYDWEAGQAFLRNRYVCWLSDNHGTIDRQKFLNTSASNDGSVQMAGDPSDWSFAGDKITDQWAEHDARKEEGLLPQQMFDSWAKAYLEDAASDETHTDHEDAKKLLDVGVFMETGFCAALNGLGAEGYRALNRHKTYYKSIKASFDIPENVMSEMASRRERKYRESVAADMKDSGENSTRVGPNDASTRAGSINNDGATRR